MPRLLIAGFQHATDTFGATKVRFWDFEVADAWPGDVWPGLLRGNEVIFVTAGINLPMAGFVEASRADPGTEPAPVVWGSAEPSAHVSVDAFERIAGAQIHLPDVS